MGGSFPEVTVPETPLQHQDGIKNNNKRKRIFSRSESNRRGIGLVSLTKIAYGDFLKRPQMYNSTLTDKKVYDNFKNTVAQ